MTIYEISPDKFRKIDEMTRLRERQDLQRLLRSQIEIVSPDTLVISEEFSQWEDSSRRIDLLGIDKEANLVVFELKCTEDGGHMDLQAIRYAAMVSAMTFERAVKVYTEFLERIDSTEDASTSLLEFLEWDEPDEDAFAQDVRIVLVSADFSKELTTSVLWLNERGLDIQCVRIKPYSDNGRILADVQPIIPLPEAADYQVRLKEKQQRERTARRSDADFTKYDVTIGGQTHTGLPKRKAMFTIIAQLIANGRSPEQIAAAIPNWEKKMFRCAEGQLNSEEFVARQANGGRNLENDFYCGEGELFFHSSRTYALYKKWGKYAGNAIDQLKEHFPDEAISYLPSP